MHFAFWAVLVAAVLPILWAGVAKSGGGYDNHAPRQYLDKLTGWRQRAQWAQQNAWEALTPFAAGVIIATLQQVPPERIDAAALVFLLARVAHGFCYVADKATLRSLLWLLGFSTVVYLFLLAAHLL
ncbi:MAPEG family protein [Vogesella oryzae]|uniref:MAPEG family protein n=1 Tax=Vogesella oryzae TaxID=1735285 RepID=UPI0015817F1B|nr:MAPEG family protein [Vogesella oryzae]